MKPLPRSPSHSAGVRGEAVGLPGAQVAVDRRGGLDGERDDPARAALATADDRGGRIGPQVEVGDLEGDDLARPGTGGEHQAQDRFVALVAQVGPPAGLEHGTELVVGERLHHGLVELGRLAARAAGRALLALLGQPGREAADGEVTGHRGGRLRRRQSSRPSTNSRSCRGPMPPACRLGCTSSGMPGRRHRRPSPSGATCAPRAGATPTSGAGRQGPRG